MRTVVLVIKCEANSFGPVDLLHLFGVLLNWFRRKLGNLLDEWSVDRLIQDDIDALQDHQKRENEIQR